MTSFLRLGQKYKNIFIRFGSNENFKICFRDLLTFKNGKSLYYKILLTIFISILTCLLMPFGLFKALVRTKLIIYILFRTLKSRKRQQLDTCYPFESTNITSKCECNVCFQKRNFFPNTCLKMLISNSFQTKNENEKTTAVTTLLTFFPPPRCLSNVLVNKLNL